MQTVIVDTDIAIDYLRGEEYAKELLFFLWETNTAYLSMLSAYELYAGMRDDEQEITENFINACNIEPVSIAITKKAGELYRHHRKQGTTMTSLDCLINATALVNGHKIATRNSKHYPDKKILFHVEPVKKHKKG